MPKYLLNGLTQYVINTFTKKYPLHHVTQDDVSAPLQRLEVERITGHQNRSVDAMWNHRGDVRNALDWAFPSVVGTGYGPSAPTPAGFALLGCLSEPTPDLGYGSPPLSHFHFRVFTNRTSDSASH